MLTSTQRSVLVSPVAALALAAGLVGSRNAFAQSRTWFGGNGAWGVPANWSPADVPDTVGESAILGGSSAYTVNSGATFGFGALSLTNPLCLLNIDASTGIGLSADSTNNGVITVNPTGVNAACHLDINAPAVAITGTGSIVLNANAANLGSAYLFYNSAANVLTLGTGQTLRGSGNVYPNVVNNGTIQADQNAKTLQLFSANKANNNVVQAINGGSLSISGITLTQGGAGSVLADGGSVLLSGMTLTGGALGVSNGGSATVTGSSTFNGVTLTGPLSINAGAVLALGGGGLTSNGTITVNPTGVNASTRLDLNAPAMTLNGTGSVVLNANAASLDSACLFYSSASNVLTVPSTQTIRGTGNIYTALVNDGIVQADQAGKVLQLFGSSKTNNNVVRAINGGIMNIAGIALTQGGSGLVVADAGTVNLSSVNLSGGTLTNTNGGALAVTASSAFNNLALNGSLSVNAGNTLTLAGSFTSNGTITVNPTGANASTHLDIYSSALTLAGTGTVVLNAHPANIDSAYIYYNSGSNVLTIPSTQTIRGTGDIYASFVNNGTIQADVSGRVLQVNGGTKTNNALIQAVGGGILNLSGLGITQGASGTLLANAGTMNLSAVTLTGGALTLSNGGSATVTASSTLSGVTLAGPLALNAGLTLTLTGGFTNHGTLTVNAAGTNVSTSMSINSPALTIGGTGTIILNANPANPDSAYIYYSSGSNVLTLAPGQTLAGRGRVYPNTQLQGTLSPGTGPGETATISLAGPMVMHASGVLDIEIGGTAVGQYDRVVSTSNFTLDGLVRVRLVNGFSNPPQGTHFDVVTATTVLGSCVLTDMPKGWSLFTLPGIVRVEFTNCPADLDCGNGVGTPDSGVDINDLLYFIAKYEAGELAADLDDGSATGTPDGGVDINDLLYFLEHYAAGC